MWITVKDQEREYVININNVIGFTKTSNCHQEPCIEIFIIQGGITLCYQEIGSRDYVYDRLNYYIEPLKI